MDFSVLNHGGGGGDKRKRRKKKKKNTTAPPPGSTAETATASANETVGADNPVFQAARSAGYTEAEISRGLAEMFDRGLAYDSERAVLTYLEHRKKAVVEENAVAPATPPRGVMDDDKPPEKVQTVPSPSGTSISMSEKLQGVLQNVKQLDAVLDGLSKWYDKSDSKDREAFFESDTLFLLFERIFREVTELTDISSAVVTRLERQLNTVFHLFLKFPSNRKERLGAAVSSLVVGMLKLRDLKRTDRGSDDSEVMPISRAAAQAVVKVHEHLSTPNKRAGSGTPVTQVENIRSVKQGSVEVAKLEKTVLPVLPRGDTLMLNKSGKLSAGDVARLFRLRDSSSKLVEISSRCLKLSRPEESSSTSAESPESTTVGDIDSLVECSQSRKTSSVQALNQVRSALVKTEARITQPEQEISGSVAEKLAELEGNLSAYNRRRDELQRELDQINSSISATTAELDSIKGKVYEGKIKAEKELKELKQQESVNTKSISIEEMRLGALGQIKRFHDLVLSCAGLETDVVSTSNTFSQDPVVEWRIRTILSIERYLGVEVSCVELLEQRIENSGLKIVELQGKVENLVTLDMPTLVKEAKSRHEQEIKNKAEDELALAALRKNAAHVADQLYILLPECKRDLPKQALFALKRCSSHISKLNMPNSILENDPILREIKDLEEEPVVVVQPDFDTGSTAKKQASQKPQQHQQQVPTQPKKPAAVKSSSSRRGWGVIAAPPVAPSLLEIQQAEKKSKEEEAKTKAAQEEETVNTTEPPKDEEVGKVEEEGTAAEKPQANKEEGDQNGEEGLGSGGLELQQGTLPRNVDPEFIVYEDDAALGQVCPSMENLEWYNGGPLEVGGGTPFVVTFFSMLNKSDICTLTLLSRVKSKMESQGHVFNMVAVSRDVEARPDSFLTKYQGKYMAESPAPNNDETLKTVNISFPLAFDGGFKFNNELKKVMKRSVVGIGMVIIFDKDGILRWYEQFNRGVNPAGQFEKQLENVLSGNTLVSNGKRPIVEGDDESEEEVQMDDDLDFLTGGGHDNY